jgi:hypothetical protein
MVDKSDRPTYSSTMTVGGSQWASVTPITTEIAVTTATTAAATLRGMAMPLCSSSGGRVSARCGDEREGQPGGEDRGRVPPAARPTAPGSSWHLSPFPARWGDPEVLARTLPRNGRQLAEGGAASIPLATRGRFARVRLTVPLASRRTTATYRTGSG